MGLAVFILVACQATLGFFRPSLPKQFDEEGGSTVDLNDSGEIPSPIRKSSNPKQGKSAFRLGWEVTHRFFGIVIIALGWWNNYSGLQEFEDAEGEQLFTRGSSVLVGMMVFFGATLLVLFSAKNSQIL